jgi:hypothetical protein
MWQRNVVEKKTNNENDLIITSSAEYFPVKINLIQNAVNILNTSNNLNDIADSGIKLLIKY